LEYRTFVPLNPQPLQPLENSVHQLGPVALDIGVFNSQQQRAAFMPREKPIEKGSAGPSDVQIASRRWRKANPWFF
jgi:hypothetical protein